MVEKNLDDAVNAILGDQNFDLEEVLDFPSGGQIYSYEGDDLPSIRSMTFEDEKAAIGIASSKKAQNKNVLSFILERCVQGVNSSSLIPGDWLYALIKLRAVSVGPDYDFAATCPECGHCSEVSINLEEDLNINRASPPLENELHLTLPKLGKSIVLTLVRAGDFDNPTFDTLYENMHRYIKSIDGVDTKAVIRQVVKKLPRADIHFILSNIQQVDIGVDRNIIFTCPACNAQNLTNVPIGEDFFTESF